jgi:aminopeptidase-like protein
MEIKEIIEESYLLNRVFVSDDTVKALENLSSHTDVPYKDFKFKSGEEFNSWRVPNDWKVVEAKILKNGKIIYDGQDHLLGVIANSSSFEGKISKEELAKHIYTAPKRPKAIPFHFRLQYRPWDNDWGFCMPQEKFDSLEDGEYEVKLKTILKPGKMVSREFTIKGESEETILFVAHIDHPGLSNDDLSGCAVGIELLNRIKKSFPRSKYTYKLLLTQEILGSVFYLHKLGAAERKNLKYGIFMDNVGNNNDLSMQKSFLGNTLIDRICKSALNRFCHKPIINEFRHSTNGADEIVFEAPGIEIPMVFITRFPYPEYHTSDENMDIIYEAKLQETVAFLLKVVGMAERGFSGMEFIADRQHEGITNLKNKKFEYANQDLQKRNFYIKRRFEGLISLANPKYNLYIDPGQIIGANQDKNKKTALWQYYMPRYLEGNYSLLDMAAEFNIDFDWLENYFNKMEEKGLIKKLSKRL